MAKYPVTNFVMLEVVYVSSVIIMMEINAEGVIRIHVTSLSIVQFAYVLYREKDFLYKDH